MPLYRAIYTVGDLEKGMTFWARSAIHANSVVCTVLEPMVQSIHKGRKVESVWSVQDRYPIPVQQELELTLDIQDEE